jgi:hypothetical protein
MKKVFFIIPALLLFVLQDVSAQFILSGEFRPRTEFSRGYRTLAAEGQDMSIATAQRTRLNALYNAETVKAKLVLQDVRFWGSQPQMVANQDFATSVHEAWAEVFFTARLSMRAGRQELVYDDHRILGNVGWAHQARSHDLMLFKFEDEFRVHLGIAHHENSDITNNFYTGPDAYKDLQFLWFNRAWDNTGFSLLFLNNGVPYFESAQNQVTRYSQTIGGRIVHSLENLVLASNLYYQTGKNLENIDISALNFLIEASYQNRFTAGYEYLSGRSYDRDDKIYAFNPLYGTNHKFNGFMDYFYVGNHLNNVGLNNVYIKTGFQRERLAAEAWLHYFASAGKVNADAGRYLGTELDLGVSWAVQPAATISAGWSIMVASENMELVKGRGDHTVGQHWGYIMLTVTPTFIQQAFQ